MCVCVCVSDKPSVKGSGYASDGKGINSGKGIQGLPFVGSVLLTKPGTYAHCIILLFS